MKFKPKTEQEVQSEGLIPAGEYDFEITKATDEVSKKGNEMIKLMVQVFDNDGNGHFIFDYLLEELGFKLRHAAYAMGMGEQYENGELNSGSFIGRTGRCKVRIQKDKTGEYPDKNVINDYLAKEGASTQAPVSLPPANNSNINDEIPF